MWEWINDNLSVLVTLLLAVFGTGGWLGFFFNVLREKKKAEQQAIKELKAENKELQEALDRYKKLELSEERIDKSQGTIYMEKLDSGNSRAICGYCWEKDHIRIPVIPEMEYSDTTGRYEEWACCQNCSKYVTFYSDNEGVTADNGNVNKYQNYIAF